MILCRVGMACLAAPTAAAPGAGYPAGHNGSAAHKRHVSCSGQPTRWAHGSSCTGACDGWATHERAAQWCSSRTSLPFPPGHSRCSGMLAPHYFLCTQPWYACILSWQVAGWSGAVAQGRWAAYCYWAAWGVAGCWWPCSLIYPVLCGLQHGRLVLTMAAPVPVEATFWGGGFVAPVWQRAL